MSKLSDSICKLYAGGLSYNEIQHRLGCSKSTISYHVGRGQKEKQKKRYRERKGSIREFVQQYKDNAICADCKEDYPYYMLDFDHVDSNKAFNVSEFYNHTSSIKTVIEEIEKCDVVCANCHRIRTHLRYHDA